MKNLVLISLILSFLTTSAFSQNRSFLKADTAGIDVSAYSDLGKYYQKSKQHQMAAPIMVELNHPLKEKARTNLLNNAQNPLDILQKNKSYDNIPCVTPVLTDAMPVFKPDSTIFYRLRIKMMK